MSKGFGVLITASLVSTRFNPFQSVSTRFKPFQPFKHVASEHTRARQVRCSWKAQQQPRILADIREAIGDTFRANGGISWKVCLFPAEQRQKCHQSGPKHLRF